MNDWLSLDLFSGVCASQEAALADLVHWRGSVDDEFQRSCCGLKHARADGVCPFRLSAAPELITCTRCQELAQVAGAAAYNPHIEFVRALDTSTALPVVYIEQATEETKALIETAYARSEDDSPQREITGEEDPQESLFGDEPRWWQEHWWGMPSYVMGDARPQFVIKMNFATFDDMLEFAKRIDAQVTRKTNSLWFPPQDISKPSEWIFVDEGEQ